jgi:vitamin B12 transporter
MSFIRRHPAAFAAPGLWLAFSTAFAQQLAPVVVTATRLPQPADRVLADVRVIDAEAIAAAGTATLAELLQARAGVEISSNGGPGQVSAVFLRGSNANHVVVLVDGVRLQSATTGTTAFEHIPLAQIERIEVLRGPASSLYGADAIGGVIQIFTRRRDASANAQLGLGSRRTRDTAAGFDRRWGDTRLGLQAAWRSTGGFSATNATHAFSFEPDDDSDRNRSLGLHLEHEWASGQSLALRGLHSDSRTQFDAGPGTDDRNRQRLSTIALESRNRVSADWSSRLLVARGADHADTQGAFPSAFDTDQDQLGWQNDLAVSGGALALGAEWRRDKVGGSTAYTVARRIVRSVYASYDAESAPHSMQASLRHDANSQFGGRTTGTLRSGWHFAPGRRASASAGHAFKAPSFNDLYFPLSFGFSGNPQLRPERSRSSSLALRRAQGNASAGLTLFHTRIRDLIAVDPSFTTVVNVADARIRGATLDAAWSTPAWQLRGEWTAQQASDVATGTRLPRRARHHGSASIDHAWSSWRGGIDLVAAGSRFDDVANSPDARMGGYLIAHLHVAQDLGAGWQWTARIENVADKAYELARGYNTPRRGLFVALKYATP